MSWRKHRDLGEVLGALSHETLCTPGPTTMGLNCGMSRQGPGDSRAKEQVSREEPKKLKKGWDIVTSFDSLPVRVNNPRRFGTWELPAERVALGPGYKPCIATLPNGELIMVALFGDTLPEGKLREWTGLWRSIDGGVTWSERERVEDMIGREHWLTCTRDGILLTTCHLLPQDVNNKDGYTTSWLHRSTDGGHTWERMRATIEGEARCGCPTEWGSISSRNIVELPDGTLLFGVSINRSSVAYLWSSKDGGRTWDKSLQVRIHGYYDNWDGFFVEDFTHLTPTGKLLHFCRVGPPSPMYPMSDGRTVPTGDDGIDRMMWTESMDGGRTWLPLRDFGDYGAHYPRIIRLSDGRLLLTFTQRAVLYPLGLQAVLSYDEGETWDFKSDRIVIDGRTPWGTASGGGFGNTVQLPDKTLVSCYSYRGWDDKSHVEVVRWSLPG